MLLTLPEGLSDLTRSSHSHGVLVGAATPKVTGHTAQRASLTRSGVRSLPLPPPHLGLLPGRQASPHPTCPSVFSAAGLKGGGRGRGGRWSSQYGKLAIFPQQLAELTDLSGEAATLPEAYRLEAVLTTCPNGWATEPAT